MKKKKLKEFKIIDMDDWVRERMDGFDELEDNIFLLGYQKALDMIQRAFLVKQLTGIAAIESQQDDSKEGYACQEFLKAYADRMGLPIIEKNSNLIYVIVTPKR